MSSYQVGNNSPIRLKVTISTVGHAATAFFLNDPANDGKFLAPPKSNSFSNTDNAGWRQINTGDPVKDRTVKVRTILTFPSGMPDENTFNLAVEQAKRSYTVQLSGGKPTPMSFDFTVNSIFGIVNVAEFVSLINFT
ncbi:MAG: hypothetical protein JKY22_08760 [Flavobacteriaceae bacterium]|nr:hypothetical protein [Flavobacteriaceae bacterium]